MIGTPKRYGPAYVANSATDILTTPVSTQYNLLRIFHFCNTDTASHTVSIYLGSSGGSTGGTEILKTYTIPANSSYDMPCFLIQKNGDYISGLCDAASKVTVQIGYESFVLP